MVTHPISEGICDYFGSLCGHLSPTQSSEAVFGARLTISDLGEEALPGERAIWGCGKCKYTGQGSLGQIPIGLVSPEDTPCPMHSCVHGQSILGV